MASMEDVTRGLGMSGGAEVADYGMKKGPWSPEEDALLIKYVTKNGKGKWKNVQKTGLMRCGKSCRLRWANHLKPDLKRGPFSVQEEKMVIELHQKVGNKWSKIAAKLPGRTDNEVKNLWNTKIKKRVMRKSQKSIGESSSSTQQSGIEEVPSNLQFMNPNLNPSLRGEVVTPMANSKAYQCLMMSFPKSSPYLINFSMEKEGQTIMPSTSNFSVLQNPSVINKPNTYPYPYPYLYSYPYTYPYLYPDPEACVLEFANGSTYLNPNPFPSFQTHIYLAKERPIVSVLDGGMRVDHSVTYDPNFNVEVQQQDPQNEEVTSIMEVNPNIKKEAMEVEEMESMNDEISSLLNIFSFDEPPPELNLKKTKEEDLTSRYRTHFYLDQKLAFPSFSGPSSDFHQHPESPRVDDECFDVEDWINETGS